MAFPPWRPSCIPQVHGGHIFPNSIRSKLDGKSISNTIQVKAFIFGGIMKRPFLVLIFLMLLLSLACSIPGKNQPEDIEGEVTVETTSPTQAVAVNPTQTVYSPPTARPTSAETPVPVATQEKTQEPTLSPTEPESSCPLFGIEEFDTPGGCWPDSVDKVFSSASISDINKINVQVKDSRLEFESQLKEDVFLYSFYPDNEYDEVIVRASVTKIEPSRNQNGFALVCHINRFGWYEARVESSGTFEIFQYDALKKQNGQNPFLRLGSGGASSFRTGTGRENILELQCRNDSLTFIVNDKQIWEKVNFTSLNSGGGVGVGLASYSNTFPRHIGFEYVEILEP